MQAPRATPAQRKEIASEVVRLFAMGFAMLDIIEAMGHSTNMEEATAWLLSEKNYVIIETQEDHPGGMTLRLRGNCGAPNVDVANCRGLASGSSEARAESPPWKSPPPVLAAGGAGPSATGVWAPTS